MKQFKKAIHIFRRDLRLQDNTALLAAIENSELVIPIFIFDNRQLDHPYRGNNSFEFLINSLNELKEELVRKGGKLHCFKGIVKEVIAELLDKNEIDAVFVNRDYTPFSRQRDEEIAMICRQHEIPLNSFADALLTEPEQVSKKDGKPYTVFTPFMRTAKLFDVKKPQVLATINFAEKPVSSFHFNDPKAQVPVSNSNLRVKGGRKEGKQLLQNISTFADYHQNRDLPSVAGTSLLSAHHKFGTISIRETYWNTVVEFGKEHPMINELYWRDFFSHIAFHFPKVLGNAFQDKYNNVAWKHDEVLFQKWCKGQTGFPIVDAGMRELNKTGYMHNRVRMITASFLTKDLHIDWRWGERYFAQQLVDYDPAVNNGNWQWAASTGCDAQPYFRIFNPWRQQQRFDPDAVYIKNWIPELRNLSAKEILKLEEAPNLYSNYVRPIVKHKEQAEIAKQLFKLI